MVSATVTFKKKYPVADVRNAEGIVEKFSKGDKSISEEEFKKSIKLILDDKDAISTLDIEKAIGTFSPLIKSCSLLPHSDAGAYKQMPYEGITKEEYEKRVKLIKPIDWTLLNKPHKSKDDPAMSKYCDGDFCPI